MCKLSSSFTFCFILGIIVVSEKCEGQVTEHESDVSLAYEITHRVKRNPEPGINDGFEHACSTDGRPCNESGDCCDPMVCVSNDVWDDDNDAYGHCGEEVDDEEEEEDEWSPEHLEI